MITIQQRDAVVNFLVLQNTSRVCLTESTLSECSVSFDELKMILEQLETMQLLTIKHITKDPCVIIAVNATFIFSIINADFNLHALSSLSGIGTQRISSAATPKFAAVNIVISQLSVTAVNSIKLQVKYNTIIQCHHFMVFNFPFMLFHQLSCF